MTRITASLLIVLILLPRLSGEAGDSIPEDSPRRTDTVRLVEKALPATVMLQNVERRDDGSFGLSSGSGLVIDTQGFVLTNNHVVAQDTVRRIVTLANGAAGPFQVVARYPFADIALVKIPAHDSLASMPIGRSHDLMLGEPTLVIGSPDRLTSTVSTGIVSGLQRGTRMAALGPAGLIQTSAPSGHGGSGGPLINALGEVIGIISSGRDNMENVAFAIPADRIRMAFPEMLFAESRYGFHLGVEVDMLTDRAVLSAIEKDSPTAKAGLQVADIVEKVGDRNISDGVSFWLALTKARAGEELVLHISRGDETLEVTVQLGMHVPWPATAINEDKLTAGLKTSVYEGLWERLPDFDSLEPVEETIAKTVTLDVTKRREHVGIVFEGYVKLPHDGLYLFGLTSDDGSRLIIDGKTVVDLDGPHPAIEHGTQLSLQKGLHQLRIEFFEAEGKEQLEVSVQSDKLNPQSLLADWLVH